MKFLILGLFAVAFFIEFNSAFGDVSTMVAFGMSKGKLLMWDWNTTLFSYTFGANTDFTFSLFLKDGRLAGQSNVSTVNVWNVTSGTVDITLDCTAYILDEMYNGWLAIGDFDQPILNVWDISSSGTLVTSISTSSLVNFIKQLVTCNFLAIGNADGNLVIFNPANNFTVYNNLIGHLGEIYGIEELPNGNLVTCSSDKTVKLWNVTNAIYLSTFNPYSDVITALKMISLDTFILGGSSQSIYVLKVNSSNQIVLNKSLTIPSTAIMINDIQVTNTDLVMIAFNDRTMSVYNSTNMELIKSYTIGTDSIGFINRLAVSERYSYNISSNAIKCPTPNIISTTSLSISTIITTEDDTSTSITTSTPTTNQLTSFMSQTTQTPGSISSVSMIQTTISNVSNSNLSHDQLFGVLVDYSMGSTDAIQPSIEANNQILCLLTCSKNPLCKAATFDTNRNCTNYLAYPPSNAEPLINLEGTNLYYKF